MSDKAKEFFSNSDTRADILIQDGLYVKDRSVFKIMQAYADEQKIEFANDVMNKAFGKNGIKGIPDSNKIAGFILEHLKQD